MYPYDWQRSIVVATHLIAAAIIVSAMYWARAVLIPFALAVLLTLVLAPLVGAIQRIGIGRVPAAVLVVVLASSLVLGVGWIVTRQFVQLAYELPAYSDTIRTKIRDVKEMATSPATGRIGKLISEVTAELQSPAEPPAPSVAAPAKNELPQDEPAAEEGEPREPVVAAPTAPAWFERLTAAIGTVTGGLGMFALAVVLTLFMLIQRERLRDRLILLIGQGRLTATTKALDEAVQRISRFLLMQLIVNGTYGIALAAGLLALGVKYALLWGLLAALLRYIPYVGAWIAAVPPVLLSFVMSEGWGQPLLVVGWIVAIELVSNNLVEPLLYGQSIGASAVALIVAAAFWAFLWGPIGLVLSSPLTVCLVVLGKHVPQLHILDILLGDKPALEPHETFYQRLLARDVEEAQQVASAQFASHPPAAVCDSLFVPALAALKRDSLQTLITEDDEEFIATAIREIATQIGRQVAEEREDSSPRGDEAAQRSSRVRILACPADGPSDQVAVEILAQLLDPCRFEVHVAPDESLAAELLDSVTRDKVALVCIGSIPPGGLSHACYFSKRLRSHSSPLKIVVGRWDPGGADSRAQDRLLAAGADQVEWSMAATARRVDAFAANPGALAGAAGRAVGVK